ncbi:MAG: TIGR00725 family protein [Actinobacteria bacterium]|nr:TIGR00725 family protein [Actinomycetota bacterium]
MDLVRAGKEIYIGVIGVGEEDEKTAGLAFEAGRLIGARGAILLCGGLGGVMNAAAKGAKETDGVTIGILPGSDRTGASHFLDYSIPTGIGHARNAIIALASDGLVAIGAGYGTLSEIALALKSGKPIVGLETWGLCKEGKNVEAFPIFTDPRDAVEAIFNLIRQR